MNYIYRLAEYILISTIEIPFLSSADIDDWADKRIIRLKVFHCECTKKEAEDYFIIDFQCNLIYAVCKDDNLIEAYTDNDEKVISSFFNIPFSMFALRNRSIVLHTSAVEIGSKAYAFSGEKGAGKSTITFLLSQKYNFFSDDTLLIKEDYDGLIAERIIPIIRLCKDTYEKATGLDNFDCYRHNISGKAYVSPADVGLKGSYLDSVKLRALFFIERASKHAFKLDKIESPIIKRLNIANNIVGINCTKDDWCLEDKNKRLLDAIADEVEFFKISVPNDFEYVAENLTGFFEKIIR